MTFNEKNPNNLVIISSIFLCMFYQNIFYLQPPRFVGLRPEAYSANLVEFQSLPQPQPSEVQAKIHIFFRVLMLSL